MTANLEEELVLLYTLLRCGGRASKARATAIILSEHLLKEKRHDTIVVSTGESKIENRIAWSRENLKRKGFLSMPERGVWAITEEGRQVLEKVAVESLTWCESRDVGRGICEIESHWERFSDEFVVRLKDLGADVKRRQE